MSTDKDMEKLGELLEKNPKLMQAALSGLQESLTKELKASGLDKQVSAAALQKLGSMNQVGGGGNPVADDYVASGVSSVLHIVKVGVADLAHNLDEIAKLNNKVDLQVNKLKLGNVLTNRVNL
ncbi:MAG: hypothetical protein K0Q59_4845 [Paenibacillus sp.]|jgi:hypothetical protein|nr:hypothetical protein [Paenibacillus sp.]